MGSARFLNGLNITGDLTVTGNILPGANNTYNIGSTSAAWKIGYFKKMSINGGDLSSSTSYTLDVGGTSNFDGNANFSANITVAGISNLQGNTIVGTTSGNGLNKTLTINGKVVVNPSYNTTNNLYNEGIRINQASNGWAEVVLGGAAGTDSNTNDNIWLVGTYSKNFYISYNGNHTAGNRFQGTPNGFRIYSNTATSAPQTGTLTLGSTDSAYNGSGSGGDVALEFWRGKNASWQILNTGGTLKFKNNYTSAAHATYDVNVLDLGYGGNDSIIYTNFKPFVTTNTTQSTLSLGLATANWDSIYTKTLNFGYDNADQYLTHSGVATLGTNHSGKITLYRLLASGTAGTRASGSKLRPAVVLDAATGLISLEAGSTNPSATAGGRIEFKYYNSDTDLGQPVYLSHSVNDSYRPPYGLKVWSGTTNTNPYAWFEIEGSLYIGTHSSATSGTDVDKKRLATSIYIGTKSNGTWNIGNAAISGYDTWLRLNDLIDFTSGTYSPFEIRSKTALSVAADTLVSDTNKHDATFYTGVDNATTGTTVTYINTSKNIILNRTSIGTEDATADDNLFYVDNWSKFKGDLRPDATDTYSLGTSNRRWKTLFIGSADTYGSGIIPIYWNSGVPTPSTSTVGSGIIPIYLKAGTLTASTDTVGSGIKPIYLNAGTLTVSNNTVGSGVKPIYLTGGTLTASTNTVGASDQPIYLSGGTLTASTSSIGSTTKGVYLSSGFIKAMTYELKATVNNGTTNSIAYYSGTNAISSHAYTRFHPSNRYLIDMTLHNTSGTTVGEMWYDAGDTTNITSGAWRFRAYSPNSTASTTTTGFYESYYLPTVDTGRTGNAAYNILTTKHTVAVAQGGTGLSSLTANRIYVGNGTNALKATDTTEFGTVGYGTVTPGNTSGNDDFYKAVLVYISKNFTGNRFIGNITPNSTGPAYGHIYNVNERDATTELPRYSTFIYHNLAGNLQVFGTNNYVFYRRQYYDSNNSGSSPWVLKAGDTMTGQLQKASSSQAWVNGRNGALIRHTATTFTANQYNPLWSAKSINGTWDCGTYTANNSLYFTYITDANFNAGTNTTTAQMEFRGSDNSIRASKVYGAVWNDYAEYRHASTQESGRCVKEVGDDTLELSTARLQPGCEIVSDTFGFAIGETEKAKTPIAASGRVLAYPYEDRAEYRNHIGEPVCSGPDGTVSIMTKEEIKEYPHCIIGTISAIPDYEEWGTNNIKVNGRIWIRIR